MQLRVLTKSSMSVEVSLLALSVISEFPIEYRSQMYR
jgi:hypothetical protein